MITRFSAQEEDISSRIIHYRAVTCDTEMRVQAVVCLLLDHSNGQIVLEFCAPLIATGNVLCGRSVQRPLRNAWARRRLPSSLGIDRSAPLLGELAPAHS